MIEHEIDIATADGAVNSVVLHPEEGGPFPEFLRCESGFAGAEIDRWAPRAGWCPGVEHGFVFPQRQGVRHRAAAERHGERLFALFDRHLRRRG
jgi:carboxymethylenebutenolidase